MANKLADLQSVVNFMMQNNVMQPPFLLQDTPVLAAKTDAQKGEQKIIPVVHNMARKMSGHIGFHGMSGE
ncbi:hypothetical protein ACSBR1_037373 [Camellia fascicularis]